MNMILIVILSIIAYLLIGHFYGRSLINHIQQRNLYVKYALLWSFATIGRLPAKI